jgi:hypothetical protein
MTYDVLTTVITRMREHFGRDIVSRRDILDWQISGGHYIPTNFWKTRNVTRGMYSVAEKFSPFSAYQQMTPAPVQPPVVEIQETTAVPVQQQSYIVSHFDRESLIPSVNENYIEWGNYKMVEKMVASNHFFTLYLTGESGSGKNEMIAHACAKLRRPMVRVSITSDTKEDHLIGSKTLVDGNIKYEEGPLIWAAENGALLILDELSLGQSSELMCLQAALEGNPFFVKSLNRVITPKQGFCIVATDNTKGRGSDSGRYIGTNVLNDAFLERFMMTMEQGYPPAKVEKEIFTKAMKKHGAVDEAFIKQLTTWIHVIRKTYSDDAIDEQITTRRGVHIVNTFSMFTSAKQAIELCTNRFDDTTKEAFIILWDKLTAGESMDGVPSDL